MKNQQSHCDFVLKTLKPKNLISQGETLERPEGADRKDYWKKALDFSMEIHSSLPFLAGIQNSSWRSEIPADIRDEFDAKLSRERMFLGLLDEELTEVLDHFQRHGIACIVLKGMDFGRNYYPNPMLRPMADIDLLVPEEQYLFARNALISSDYHIVGVDHRSRFRVELSRGGGRPVVELHYGLIAGDKVSDVQGYWERAKLIANDPNLPSYLVLSDQDSMLYIVRHAAVQHLVESPIWLNDAHFALEKFGPSLDWAWIGDQIKRKRISLAALFFFQLLQWQCETELDSKLFELLGGRSRWRKFVLSRIRLEDWFESQRQSSWSVAYYRAMFKGGARDLLRYGASYLLSKT